MIRRCSIRSLLRPLAALGLLATACAPAAPPAAQPTAAPAAVPTAAPAPAAKPTSVPAAQPTSVPAAKPAAAAITRQNTLVIATPEDVLTFDPPVGGNELSGEVDWQMYDMPVNYVFARQANGTLQQQGDKTEPALAEKIDTSPDGKTITLHLRKGVTFHPSGSEMTAKDMDWVIRRNLELKKGFGGFFLSSASISKPGRIVDTYTYELTLDKPNPSVLPILALIGTAVIDSDEAKKHATADDPWASSYLERNVLGTGPYALASFKPGQEIVLEARPNSWREPPFFKRIVYRIVPEPAARLTLLRAKEVDIAWKLPGQEVQSLEGVEGITVQRGWEPRIPWMWLNCATGPTADLRVRQALAYAVPYRDILNTAFLGVGRPHTSMFTKEALGHIDDTEHFGTTNLEKARALLAQSPHPNGFSSTLAVDPKVPGHEQAAVLIQSALKPLNIDLSIALQPTAQFVTAGAKREHPLALHGGFAWVQEGTYIMNLTMTPDAILNWSGCKIPAIGELLPTLFTPDAAVRKAGYERAQKLFNEQVPFIPFAQQEQRVAMLSTIQNFTFTATGYPQYAFASRSP